jgi:hypothetical protein
MSFQKFLNICCSCEACILASLSVPKTYMFRPYIDGLGNTTTRQQLRIQFELLYHG